MIEDELDAKCISLAIEYYQAGEIREVRAEPEAALRLYRKAAELDKHTGPYVQAVERVANQLTIFYSHKIKG